MMLFLYVFSIIFIFATVQDIKVMFSGKLHVAARNRKQFLKDHLMNKDTKTAFCCDYATKKAVLPY